MKRLFVLIAVTALVFGSCKKYKVSDPVDLETLQKVTLKGTVYVNTLDETVPTLQFAPAGTIVRVSVPYADYDATNASGGFYVKTTTLDANGGCSIEVPVVASGVTATITFADFTAQVKTQNAAGEIGTELRHFSCNPITVNGLGTGRNAASIKIDVTYQSNATDPNANVIDPSRIKKVTAQGKIEYVKMDSSHNVPVGSANVWDVVPAGTKITAVISLKDADGKEYSETQTVTVGVAGTYTLQVPMVEFGKATVTFLSEQFWEISFVGVAAPDDKQMWQHILNSTNAQITLVNVPIQTHDLRYKKVQRIP